MRGGYLHRRLLVTPLEEAFQAYEARTWIEFAVTTDGAAGFIDLLAACDDRVVAVEAELTPRRVTGDLIKACAIAADELWIVVPTRNVAKAVRRVLDTAVRTQPSPEVFVLTLGAALQRVRECFPLFSPSNASGKQIPATRYEGAATPARINAVVTRVGT